MLETSFQFEFTKQIHFWKKLQGEHPDVIFGMRLGHEFIDL